MVKERGLCSSNDAKPWKCRCGKVNHPKKYRFADLPSWECRGCKREFNGTFKFCLGEIEVDGGSLIGEVWDQEDSTYCVAFAYGKGIEIVERVSSVNNGTDPNEVECIDPIELEHMFEMKFPDVASKESISKSPAVHKALHMGLMLKEEGIPKPSSRQNYKLEDLSTIPRDDFSSIMDCLAQGIPFVGTYLAGKRRSKLKYCQIYKSAPLSRYTKKKAQRIGHAVVLTGGGMKKGRKFFYGLNSWDVKFCPRRNTKGEIIRGGIGKIQASDLTKNVIKLSQPEKTDSCRRLEAQDVFDISNKNFILMMALKNQFTAMLRRSKQVKSGEDDDKMKCDDELFEKFRNDHLVHGPFCDDEAEYPQNWEDRYEEMEGNHMTNEKLPRNEVTKTDDTIHSLHGVAQSATSATCSESGTGRPFSSRSVATDGGLRGLQAGRPVYQTHQQLKLNQSPSLSREASKALRQENMPGKPPEKEELVFCRDYKDLQKSLEQARKLSLRKQEEAAGSDPQSEAELATANKGQGDADAAEGDAQRNKVVITEMEEFLWSLQLNEEKCKQEAEDVFMDEDEDDMPSEKCKQEAEDVFMDEDEDDMPSETCKEEAEDVFMDEDEDDMPSGTIVKDDTSALGVIKEETVIEDLKKDAEEEEVIPDEAVHESAVGMGLAGALKFLNEGTNWGGRTTDKKKSKLVGIEDVPKEICIERMDEFGRVITPKEAFRDLLHTFHGKEPDKLKLEKRQKKYQGDLKSKQVKSSKPLMSTENMREAQAHGQTQYLVLSGNAKSGDDNRDGNGTAEELQAGSTNSRSSKNVLS